VVYGDSRASSDDMGCPKGRLDAMWTASASMAGLDWL